MLHTQFGVLVVCGVISFVQKAACPGYGVVFIYIYIYVFQAFFL